MLINDELCRFPGNKSSTWSQINAHGWFSYELKVKKNSTNRISFSLGSATENLNIQITIGESVYFIKENLSGKKDYVFEYEATNEDTVRIRIDRVDENTPFIFNIKVN